MAGSPKEKFEAAVKVIQSLPKDGAFQPSHALMLKFYAYFKQANVGKCNIPRPAFWDVVGKAKWDAWNGLGDMPKEQAMLNYVDELKKVLVKNYPNGYNREEIVEAMPHTAMVQDFVQKLDNFYELVDSKPSPTPKVNGNVPNGNGHSSGSDDDQRQLESRDVDRLSQETQPLKKSSQDENGDVSEEEKDEVTEHVVTSPVTSQFTPVKEVSRASLNANVDSLNGNEVDSDGEEFCDTSDSPQSQGRAGDDSWQAPPSLEFPPSSSSSSTAQITPTRQSSTLIYPGQGMGDAFLSPTIMTDREQSAMFTGDNSLGGFADGTWQVKSARGAGELPAGSMATNPSPSSSQVFSAQQTGAQQRGATGRSHLLAAGSGAGGSGGGGEFPTNRPEVTQQIAVALVRLQQDMNSVLTRLNTLEALTVAQSQRRSRTNSGSSQNQASPAWWPFPRSITRSWFFILVWPFIVHWLITFISRRRNRRR